MQLKPLARPWVKEKERKEKKNKQQREIHLLKQPHTWKSRTGRDSSESNMKSVQK